MKTKFYSPLLFGLLLAASPRASQAAQETSVAPEAIPTRKEAVLVSVTATVEAIDYGTREVTLKGSLGNTVTFNVDARVKRLLEIKVGDLVQANYYISVVAELRKPTAEEAEHPLVVTQVAGKAPLTEDPAAIAAREFKVVTTVEGIDRSTQTVTVKGPRGRTLTARAKNPDRLKEIQIGDTIVITYTEALAVSLEKIETKN
jgi:Cu/Ag efflux protein CusF